MLRIHHGADATDSDIETRTPDKIYADTCWLANPRLSPDWWHEALGSTIGKLGMDWRNQISQPEHLATGCNFTLVSPATWPQVQALLATQPSPEAFMVVLVTPALENLPATLPSFLIWQPSESASHATALHQLETLVKNGQLEGYGIAIGTHPLHLWLEEAAEAAALVWARRKRPALRLLLANFDLLDLSLLTSLATQHKEEAVSTLELAARLSLAVIATPAALPDETPFNPAALQSLTAAAEAEHALNQHLGGWPQINGQPLFNLLTPLSRGHAPWPTPAYWQAWQEHVYPELTRHWATLATPQSTPFIQAYQQALHHLVPHGPTLASAAAQPLLSTVLQHLAPRFPAIWTDTDSLTQTLALLGSIPGITALALAVTFNPQPLQQRPNLPDVGRILLEKTS